MTESSRPARGWIDIAWLVGLVAVVGGIYLSAAGNWGFWEPWETEYARLGRTLNETRAFDSAELLGQLPAGEEPAVAFLRGRIASIPVGDDGMGQLAPPSWTAPTLPNGDLVNKTWLTAFMLRFGYGLGGGNELGLRFPFLLLALIAVGFAYYTIRQFTSATRAGLSALALATCPFFLMSAVNIAGAMPAMATTSMALCAWSLALCRPTSGKWWFAAAGALTGLSLWGGAMPGLLMVVGSVGLLGLWSLQRSERGMGVGRAIAAGLVVAGGGAYAYLKISEFGFDEVKDLLGLMLPLFAIAAVWIAAAGSPRLGRMGRSGLLLAVAAGAAVAVPPILSLMARADGAEVVQFLLYNDFLSTRGGIEHVSFDVLIRQVGFAAYPYTIFFPLGLAYLLQTSRREADDSVAALSSDAGNDGMAAFKVLLVAWFALGLVLAGLNASLTRHYMFIAMLPMAAAVGLVLTDVGYWKGLRKNGTVHYLIGFGCLCIFMVLTKDLKTSQDLELGVMGPEVLFETMVVDGHEAFPESYSLRFISVFRIAMAALLALYFWFSLPWTGEMAERLRTFIGDVKQSGRWLARVSVRLLIPAVWALDAFQLGTAPVRWIFPTVKRFAVAATALCVMFAGLTATAYLPDLSNHLSHRGIIDTYRGSAEAGEGFYWVGASRSNTNYYLGAETVRLASGDENPISQIRSVSGLREHFCNTDQRIFAMLERDAMAQAYYEVRHHDDDDAESCSDDRNLWVIDGRSSRYVLVSNSIEEGEENQSPIAENTFTEETLPADTIRVDTQYTFDGKIRIVGYRVSDENGDLLGQAGSGDTIFLETFFEVLERPDRSYKMFIHIDHRSQRINGDHDVVDGVFPLNYWVPGEIVRDRFEMEVDRASTAGDYDINIGFFSGDSRMRVRPAVGDNRITLGQFRITGGL